jgi:hypothetical protein
VRAVGAVYWEGRLVNSTDALIKCIVGEDWMSAKVPDPDGNAIADSSNAA